MVMGRRLHVGNPRHCCAAPESIRRVWQAMVVHATRLAPSLVESDRRHNNPRAISPTSPTIATRRVPMPTDLTVRVTPTGAAKLRPLATPAHWLDHLRRAGWDSIQTARCGAGRTTPTFQTAPPDIGATVAPGIAGALDLLDPSGSRRSRVPGPLGIDGGLRPSSMVARATFDTAHAGRAVIALARRAMATGVMYNTSAGDRMRCRRACCGQSGATFATWRRR